VSAGNTTVSKNVTRAQYLLLYDFWFTDNGILRVSVLSWHYLVGAVGIALVGGAALFGWLGGLILGLLSYLALNQFAKAKRKKLSKLSIEELSKLRGSLVIPWSAVEKIKLRKGSLLVQVGRTAYRVENLPMPTDLMANYLRSKIGEKVFVDI
jgi:hypothetical protein